MEGKRQAEEQARKEKEEQKLREAEEKERIRVEKEAEREAEKQRKELEKEAEKARKNSWQFKVGKQVERTTNAALNSAGRKVANEILKALFKR